jgi:hypothetical protein
VLQAAAIGNNTLPSVMGQHADRLALLYQIRLIVTMPLVPADTLFSTKEHDSSINNSIPVPRSRNTSWPRSQNERWKIPPAEWDAVLFRVEAGESYRHIAKHYALSHEAVRRVVLAARGRNG